MPNIRLFLSLVFSFSLLSSGLVAENLSVAGSSTVKPIVTKAIPLLKKSHPDLTLAVGGGGSSNGVKSAAAGKVDVGMASRGLKDKEKTAYPDLVATQIATDAVVLVVNKSNALSGLTAEQVKAIFTGKLANWSDVGGGDGAIKVNGQLLHHGTSGVFLKFFGLEAEEAGEGAAKTVSYFLKGESAGSMKAKGVDGSKVASASVIADKMAISFSSFGLANDLAAKGAPIKILTLDGVEASAANVQSGTYKLSRPLLLLTKGEPTGASKTFIDFILNDEIQKIVSDMGYLPAK